MQTSGEKDIAILLKSMKPELNEGEYVFCVLTALVDINPTDIICSFKEREGETVIIPIAVANKHGLAYTAVMSWITLTIHSSLEAVGLTAAFSNALADAAISCNVVAAYYHDHIFVPQKDEAKAMEVLTRLQNGG